MKITNIHAREVLDSRGNPTVEAEVTADGITRRAIAPSGASTGSHEAHELRDGGKRYMGKGVQTAVANVNGEIRKALFKKDALDQKGIDKLMCELDGTENKKRLGANAILAVSLATAHVAAAGKKKPLYYYVHSLSKVKRPMMLPLPMCNVLNGGAHTNWETTDLQEFMIMPVGAKTFSGGLQMVTEVFHNLKKVLKERGYSTSTGDEGGFAPTLKGGNEEALAVIKEATEKAGYVLGKDIALALDCAATELYEGGSYLSRIDKKKFTADEMIAWYEKMIREYPIVSIEDGLAEDDWDGWKKLTRAVGKKTQIVGDDLLVTNVQFLERAITEKASNAILIKPNQIGTLSETVAAVDMAHKAGFRAVMSHRSGETEDTTIAHLAVGLGTGQIKTGSLARTDRTAKYNELLRIEDALGKNAVYAGKKALQ